MKEAIACAVCACALGGTAANAQLVIGASPSSEVHRSASSSSNELSSLDVYNGAFIVNRFGARDGRIVAFGRLVPTESLSGVGLGVRTESGVDVSTSLPQSSSSSSSVSLGSSATSRIGVTTRTDWGVNSEFDITRLGSWTGIGTGYGESGVESRSNMTHDIDGTTAFNLGRPYDDQSYMEDISRSGSSVSRSGVDLQMGPTSANDRTSIDVQMGPTSANDRTSVDVQMGPTSANDRTGIDLKFGPTSGNDRVASGGIDLKFGPTSGNDRTSIDARFGPTSANDRTSIDARFGPTSGNDRTSIDLQAGPTSGNDRVATGIDVQMGLTSGNDRTVLSLRDDGRPLIRLGGSQTLYSKAEAERAMMVAVASEDIAVPVTLVSASCDAVSLSFGGVAPIVVTSSSLSSNETLCALSSATASGDNAMLLKYLNRLISATR